MKENLFGAIHISLLASAHSGHLVCCCGRSTLLQFPYSDVPNLALVIHLKAGNRLYKPQLLEEDDV